MQKRIVILASGGTLVIWLLLGVLSTVTVDQGVRRALQERLNLAEALARHLDYVLKENMDSLQAVLFADGVDVEDGELAPERRALRNAYFHTIFADGVYILDKNGRLLWREPVPLTERLDFSGYDHVRAALATGKPMVSDVYVVNGTGKPVVSVALPARNFQGEIVGIVGGDIDLTSGVLQKVVQPIGLSASGYIEVVDGRGVVVASSIQSRVLKESDHSDRLKALIREKRSSVSTCHDCHQDESQTAGTLGTRDEEIMALVSLQTAGWGLVIREAERDALAPARQMQREFVLLGVPIFAIAVLLAWGTAQSVINPIKALTRVAERIAGGDLTVRAPVFGDDEIGKLARAFETMRLQLKAYLDGFQRLNQELEDRVKQRTEELQRSQRELMRINEELSLLNQEILRKERIRGELLKKLISVQEEERKRIARELHDETSQSLAALVVALEALMLAPFRGRDDLVRKVESAKTLAVRTLDEIHKLIFDLRPSLLDDLGLIPAINWYAESRLKPEGIRVSVDINGVERRLAAEIETALFRVVQEAITNVTKHACAKNVNISFDFGDRMVVVEIEDDGIGFDASQCSKGPRLDGGFGLIGMRERVSLLGGDLEIQSEIGGGTAIRIQVPISIGSEWDAKDKSVVSG